jgi:hypothetical protein
MLRFSEGGSNIDECQLLNFATWVPDDQLLVQHGPSALFTVNRIRNVTFFLNPVFNTHNSNMEIEGKIDIVFTYALRHKDALKRGYET